MGEDITVRESGIYLLNRVEVTLKDDSRAEGILQNIAAETITVEGREIMLSDVADIRLAGELTDYNVMRDTGMIGNFTISGSHGVFFASSAQKPWIYPSFSLLSSGFGVSRSYFSSVDPRQPSPGFLTNVFCNKKYATTHFCTKRGRLRHVSPSRKCASCPEG